MAKFVGVDIFTDINQAKVIEEQYKISEPPRTKIRVIRASGGISLNICDSETGHCSPEYENIDSVYIVYSELEV